MADYSAIRAELKEQLRRLVARAEEIDNNLREPGDSDWEDRAVEAEGDEVLSQVGNLAMTEIAQIKDAIHRIDEGKYGKCTRCGATIPEERLAAIPYATTCTGCA